MDHVSRLTGTFLVLEGDEGLLILQEHRGSLADCKNRSDWPRAVGRLLLASTLEVDVCPWDLCDDLLRQREVVSL